MCGIAGGVNLNGEPVSPVILKNMTDAIAHRGPDGEGHWIEGNVGLGHRRLAILDLSPAGHQPMVSADHRYVLAYNGEVYNYRELRAELEPEGYWFRSQTDSEVVLYALAHWGTDALLRFNGMFALALWDRKRQELLLARDRYGIKPLYYARKGDLFLFGSEIKAMLKHPGLRAELDKKALLEYLTFQNFFTERTLFSDVSMLPPGSYLQCRARRPSLVVERYWDFDFHEPESPAGAEEHVEELDRLIRQAVGRQLVSDVEVGAYLSGGMDSGSITALAATQLPYMKTFTVGFDLSSASGIELGFDERANAERMSYLFRTEHYEMVLKAGDMERCMSSLVHHLEEPRVGQSYPNFYAAKLAGSFVKVVLSGVGGDEMFAGYPWRYYRAVVNDSFEQYVDKYYRFWQRLVPDHQIRALFRPIRNEVEDAWAGDMTRDIFRKVFPEGMHQLDRPEDFVNHSLYLEARTFLHGLLVVEDKLSMAHGLEARVPLLDNDLVDFAMRVPVRMKLGNLGEVVRLNENFPGSKKAKYFRKTRDGKSLLRKAMRRYIPREISEGEKQGFSAPDASWFRGESMEYVRDRLFGRDARIYAYLDQETVHALLHEHLRGEQNRRLLIWSLLCLEEWCRLFVG